jgi:peptide/nickel transport system permease protein
VTGNLGRRLRRRLGGAFLALAGASTLIWVLVPLAPGNPSYRILRAQGVLDPSPSEVGEIANRYGLDRPLPAQYLIWAKGVARGDFGVSYMTGRPVAEEMRRRLPATLRLTVATMGIALFTSVLAALAGTRYRGRWPDAACRVVAFLTATVPSFVVGFLLLEVLIVEQGWGQVAGTGDWAGVWLPACALSFGLFATWSRLLRSELTLALESRFAFVLRARGLAEHRILTHHALPVAAPPFLQTVGLGFGAVLSGAPVIEAVFTWPGLGSFAVQAVNARDLPVVQGYAIYATFAYVMSSTLVDIAAAAIDPSAEGERSI